MRGLTDLERYLLQRRADDAPRVTFYGASESQAFAKLRAVGRMTSTRREEPQSPTGYVQVNHITDLGRLALRCCPVGE